MPGSTSPLIIGSGDIVLFAVSIVKVLFISLTSVTTAAAARVIKLSSIA
jgi:hypothetical protein